jgi:hypothetical protein
MAHPVGYTELLTGVVLMIYVKPAILTESEHAMGATISEREFNARYRPWLAPVDRGAQDQGGEGCDAEDCAGESAPDSQDESGKQTATGCMGAQS